jgi:hypothetical protein
VGEIGLAGPNLLNVEGGSARGNSIGLFHCDAKIVQRLQLQAPFLTSSEDGSQSAKPARPKPVTATKSSDAAPPATALASIVDAG